MAPFPINWVQTLGDPAYFIVYLIIGFAFGYVLEIAGFGKSTKLAAQFYFKEMTVLKVMFSAIVVAMVLIFLTSALGWLDYNLVYVNPTYLFPGIVGGLIMGAGFIIGGFCPGTSIVSAATLKLDGVLFLLGVFFGIFLFGETVGFYESFWYSSYMGRFTLMDLFNLDTGWTVLLVLVLALGAFWASELAERVIGKKDPAQEPRWRYQAAGGLVILAVAGLVIGQPTTEDRWNGIAETQQPRIDNREVQIHPAELLSVMSNRSLVAYMIDVRDESDYNQFHVMDAHHITLDELPDYIAEFHLQPANTVFIVMSNDETRATEAWRLLVAEAVPNVYMLEGGINNWLTVFADESFQNEARIANHADDTLAYQFTGALGARYPAADPNPDVFASIEYESRVKLELKRGPTSGGCG